MARIASFHLVREPGWKTPLALARLGADRPQLSRVDGLHFWRLLGTGRGGSTGPGGDLSRTAAFAVWDDESDLDRFLESHRIARRWRRAEESWHVRLRAVGGHGRWRGVDVLDEMERADGRAPSDDRSGSDDGGAGSEGGARRRHEGPVAILTRADVRRRAGRDFREASREVDVELHRADGLIDVVGIGEAPIGRLATFSLWESLSAARDFAYAMPRHERVIAQTRDGGWYSEELFARFAPYGSTGSWDGRDPLAGR